MEGMLKGKVAIVTGSARGLGNAIAREIALAGASVVLVDVLTDRLHAAATDLHALGVAVVLPVQCDVSKADQVESMVDAAFKHYGHVDILINNAGLIRKDRLVDIKESDWDLQFAVNIKGMFLCSQAVVRRWIQAGLPGSIVNISSVHGKISFPDASAYAATKGAVNLFTRSLASELAQHRINVNAIAPGAMETELNTAFYTPPVRAAMAKRIPWGEIGDPSDVGYAAVYLTSERARYITGEILYIDGGLAMDGREVIE